MRNLDPVNLLLKGTLQQVLAECKRCISIAAPGGDPSNSVNEGLKLNGEDLIQGRAP